MGERGLYWGLLAVAAAVFVYVLATNFDHGLWFDEVFSLRVSDPATSVADAASIHASDASPTSYYVLLRGWRMAFGPGYYAAQSFNIVVFALAAAAAWIVWPKGRFGEYAIWLGLTISSAAVVYYLLEIRMYGLMCALALFMAACINRLIEDAPPSRARGLYAAVGFAAALMISMHAWGALFGAGVLLSLFVYERFYGKELGWMPWLVSGAIILALFVASFWTVISHFGERTTAAGIVASGDWAASLRLLVTGGVQLLYVTDRSLVIAAPAFLLIAGFAIAKFGTMKRWLLVSIVPIVFVYGVVVIGYAVTGRLIYKSYFNVILIAFVFLFVAKAVYAVRRNVVRWALAGALLLANLGSIPFTQRFADQPYRLEITDGVVNYPGAAR